MQNHEEGTKMRVEKPPEDSVWTMSTPLWPDKHAMSGPCLVRRNPLSEEDRRRRFPFVDSEYFFRISEDVRPTASRCATITRSELASVRQIEDIVRLGRVLEVDSKGITLEQGRHEVAPGALYVDCTANGLTRLEPVTVFEEGLITLQSVVMCQQVYSAAFIAHIEARFDGDEIKNELTNAVPHPEVETDFLHGWLANFHNEHLWSLDPEIVQWRQDARLAGLTTRVGTPLPPSGPEREGALEGFRELLTSLIAKTQVLIGDADGKLPQVDAPSLVEASV
jgi:hypothetical protein